MNKFGNCPHCSKDGLVIPLKRENKILVCSGCKSVY